MRVVRVHNIKLVRVGRRVCEEVIVVLICGNLDIVIEQGATAIAHIVGCNACGPRETVFGVVPLTIHAPVDRHIEWRAVKSLYWLISLGLKCDLFLAHVVEVN